LHGEFSKTKPKNNGINKKKNPHQQAPGGLLKSHSRPEMADLGKKPPFARKIRKRRTQRRKDGGTVSQIRLSTNGGKGLQMGEKKKRAGKESGRSKDPVPCGPEAPPIVGKGNHRKCR